MNATSVAAPIASAQPSSANIQLMQATNAFVLPRCLYVVADAGIADHLHDAPQSTEALAKATATNPEALHRLLRLLASQGIFEWRSGA